MVISNVIGLPYEWCSAEYRASKNEQANPSSKTNTSKAADTSKSAPNQHEDKEQKKVVNIIGLPYEWCSAEYRASQKPELSQSPSSNTSTKGAHQSNTLSQSKGSERTAYNIIGLPLQYCSSEYRASRQTIAISSSPTSASFDSSTDISSLIAQQLQNGASRTINNIIGLPLEYCSSEYRSSKKDKRKRAPRLLWRPKEPEKTPISIYRKHVNSKFNANLKTSQELHTWSVQNSHEFWRDLYSYTKIIPPLPQGKYAYDPNIALRDIPDFFPGHKLNFGENLLMSSYLRTPDVVALTGLREGHLEDCEDITWRELHHLVRITYAALVHHGVKESDVVAALMSNSIWTIVLFLATSAIGAIFTSISPDMGLSGCLSRLSQVTPVILFADTDFAVRGTRPSLLPKVRDILKGLPKSQRRPATIFVPTTHAPHKVKHSSQNPTIPSDLGIILSSFLVPVMNNPGELVFNRVPTSHPLFILYSSGTSGPPKCIVSPHISLLNYRKIATLHNSLTPQSTVFQYTSTSWVLFQVSLGHLTNGVRLIILDGNPLYPDASTPLRICERYNVTYWGTSPRFLLELEQQSSRPNSSTHPRNFKLDSLRMVTTTGAPLLPSQMRYFYEAFPKSENIHLSSIAGGTDICSSWIASDPAGPLYENEMQMWALGHDCDILDADPQVHTDANGTQRLTYHSLMHTTQPGELICRKPLPSMPVFFWGDDEKKSKYMEAYYQRFPLTNNPNPSQEEYLDVWAQHDLVVRNPVTGGLQIPGRSDTTLNPSGIRFGSSEIYHIIESQPFNTLISDSLCVGRRRKNDVDEAVFLFLIPAENVTIDEPLLDRIRSAIRENLSARHVPKFMYQVKEIPYTINGKRVEAVVKKIISGQDVVVSSTITNPECLEAFKQYRDVERTKKDRTSKL